MLLTRIITAIVLLLIVATVLSAASPWPMLALLTLMATLAFWEWLRLAGLPGVHAVGLAAIAFLILIIASRLLFDLQPGFLLLFNNFILPLALLFWLFIAPIIVKRASLPAGLNRFSMVLVGIVVMSSVWYALGWFYMYQGAAAFISLWALVWCADIFAYFTGRALGRHKLAPAVSPGKTIEGAIGGVLAAVLWVSGCALWWPDSFGAIMLTKFSWPILIIVTVLLAIWSIIGDLFESVLKRTAGVKDSSRLLPGHGGIYDRIDAVLPVAPASVLLFIL